MLGGAAKKATGGWQTLATYTDRPGFVSAKVRVSYKYRLLRLVTPVLSVNSSIKPTANYTEDASAKARVPKKPVN